VSCGSSSFCIFGTLSREISEKDAVLYIKVVEGEGKAKGTYVTNVLCCTFFCQPIAFFSYNKSANSTFSHGFTSKYAHPFSQKLLFDEHSLVQNLWIITSCSIVKICNVQANKVWGHQVKL